MASTTIPAIPVKAEWEKTVRALTTLPTLQVVVNPLLRRGSPIHQRAFAELQRLGADAVRFVPWFPYPRLAIAELFPPEAGRTSWDFTLIDPLVEDLFNATRGHSVMLNFSTIPPWMFIIDEPVSYPDDPDQTDWTYQKGSELRDPSNKELADYFARLAAWYARGGFTDEAGKRHDSNHRFKIDYWEVFNEPDLEHGPTPQQYTERYDAIVEAVRAVDPEIKFVGLSLAYPAGGADYFEYFLNPANHKPGIPLDMISYHFYAIPAPDESEATHQFTYFAQADGFLNTVRYVESIRKRLSPSTQTTINEIGVIRAEDTRQASPGYRFEPFPAAYWNLAGALYAYLYAHLSVLGIDIAGESQLVGYPSQFPSVSMVDWETGGPNARFRVLELLKKHFAAGGQVIETHHPGSGAGFHSQAYRGADGRRKLLLVSKRDRVQTFALPGFSAAEAEIVDQTTSGGPARAERLNGETFSLPGFGVAVVTA